MSCGTWYIQVIWQGLASWSSSQTRKSFGISGQIYGLISSFLSNRRLRGVPDDKFSQEYPVIARVLHSAILRPTLFLLYINDLPDDFTCDIAIYADDTTLYSKCDQASDLWQKLELASELGYLICEGRSGARSGLLISILRKPNWFGLPNLIRLVLLMWK